jgi:hypothetical protein
MSASQWERLANEAIGGAGEWKDRCRKLESVNASLLAALRACHDCLNENFAVTNTIEGRRAVIAMNTARAALAKGGV